MKPEEILKNYIERFPQEAAIMIAAKNIMDTLLNIVNVPVQNSIHRARRAVLEGRRDDRRRPEDQQEVRV